MPLQCCASAHWMSSDLPDTPSNQTPSRHILSHVLTGLERLGSVKQWFTQSVSCCRDSRYCHWVLVLIINFKSSAPCELAVGTHGHDEVSKHPSMHMRAAKMINGIPCKPPSTALETPTRHAGACCACCGRTSGGRGPGAGRLLAGEAGRGVDQRRRGGRGHQLARGLVAPDLPMHRRRRRAQLHQRAPRLLVEGALQRAALRAAQPLRARLRSPALLGRRLRVLRGLSRGVPCRFF